ncbi:NB-ARC domain-containing protein [Mycena venus]|uniref:NB-ARC domain-containing protein n=1 Tax=Mycena venus TaxID=2733690 RepID=A0A8H6WNR3_9AGAR|nr:NB-ARC domain-containing protein [Mycena venus]
MPPRSSPTSVLLGGNITSQLTPIITVLNELDESFGPPYLYIISSTAQALITAVQNVKRNKTECIQLVERIHGILHAVVYLHIKSETPRTLPPETLSYIGKFVETLYKMNTFVEAQQDGNAIKHFFRQSEMNTLLKECDAGLREVGDGFKRELGAAMFNRITEMDINADIMHKELLELVSKMSDRSSSVMTCKTSSFSSSDSLSMLQPKPQIFHGRESELEHIITHLTKESARIAILGAEVEEFLSLLTDVPHLALIVTMRGAERPGKILWTRPFLLPLRPLSNDAARQTFC